jgi:hypothetical protein
MLRSRRFSESGARADQGLAREVPSGHTLFGGAIIVAAITSQALAGTRRRPLRRIVRAAVFDV